MRVTRLLRHRVKMLVDGKFRELERLRTMARFTPRTTMVLGHSLQVVDGPLFYNAYEEIWCSRCYEFPADTRTPYIIDVGANFGLSVLFFKSHYPTCKLIAFEADPAVFAVLKRNVDAFGYRDVTLVDRAVWKADGILRFNSEGADGGRLLGDARGQTVIEVPATRLRSYLSGPVDFLKMDIDGAETDVLLDCRDLLGNVRNLFVEYHSFLDKPQTLHTLLALLHNSGFRVHAPSIGTVRRPFLRQNHAADMDLQLNIFAHRLVPGVVG